MPFTFIDNVLINQKTPLQPFKEFEWDLLTHDYVVTDGQIHILEGKPALKIWIYKTLLTQRARYKAYTWDYGNDLDTLIGINLVRDILVSEAKRITEEALLMNKHIFALKEFKAWMDGADLHIEFIAVTTVGELEISI